MKLLIISISLSITDINKNIEKIIISELKNNLEGKCNSNGLIKKDSIEIMNYSPGILKGSI